MWPDPQSPVDLVTFTEEILNGKLHFLCSETLFSNELKIRFKATLYIWVKIANYKCIRY